MKMTDGWIEKQLELCARATVGPYKVWRNRAGRTWLNGEGGRPIALFTDDSTIGRHQDLAGIGSVECAANAEMFREMATSHPPLLRELQRLRALLENSILEVD